jgi:hypothetical protein
MLSAGFGPSLRGQAATLFGAGPLLDHVDVATRLGGHYPGQACSMSAHVGGVADDVSVPGENVLFA